MSQPVHGESRSMVSLFWGLEIQHILKHQISLSPTHLVVDDEYELLVLVCLLPQSVFHQCIRKLKT
jgi:hypothetical protein